MAIPPVQYAITSDDVRIAYQDYGEGPPVVFCMAAFTHLTGLWNVDLVRRRLLEPAGRHQRALVFDHRGSGLSDGFETPPTLDDRALDIVAVLDAAGIERASLSGFDLGGQVAVAFAARYPERVDRLVLMNSRVGPLGRARAEELNPDIDEHPSGSAEARLEQVRRAIGLGTEHQWVETTPSALKHPEYIAARPEYERLVGSRFVWRRQIESIAELDITEHAPLVAAETLIACNDNRVHHLGYARLLHELIPNSTLVEFDGEDVEYWVGDNWAEIAAQQVGFITGEAPQAPVTSRFGVVMFTDLVGSTSTSLAMGDAEWRAHLEQYDHAAEAAIASHNGTIVKHTGDGHLAIFDRPDDALRAAIRLRDRMAGAGIALRTGLHAGLVEERGTDISGAVVNLASRVESSARTNSVFTTSTIRDMLLGTRFRFESAGLHSLSGFDEPWHLFAAEGDA